MKLFPEIDPHPSRVELLKFGIVLLVASGVAGAWAWERGQGRAAASLAAFGAAMFAAALLPVVGRLVYIGWMTLGVAMGRVTSPIVLLVVYALLVVPAGLAFRWMSRDMLRRRRDERAASYWENYPRSESVASYLRQS